MMAPAPKSIFISYSHSDRGWLERLLKYLIPLQKRYACTFFSDLEISPGDEWRIKLNNMIKTADIAILLVSQDFIASDFIQNNELPPLLEAAEKRGLKILSVIVRPCSYRRLTIEKYQAINDPRKALNTLNQGEQDTVLLELTDYIEVLLNVAGELKTKIPEASNDKRVIIFDIDGTLLFEDEDLGTNDTRFVTNQLEELIHKGFDVVFITGNDYQLQKQRVLLPLINRGIAHAVTCFSDGGSRVFDFGKGDFSEDIEYSKEHLFKDEEVTEIDRIISTLIDEFLKQNPAARTPNISLYKQDKKQLDLLISPIRSEFIKQSLNDFRDQIYDTLSKIEMKSGYNIDTMITNGVIVRLSGIYALSDSFTVQNRLQDLFHTSFQGVSDPELLKRGGQGYTCQLALKPFKNNDFRTRFLDKIRECISGNDIGDRFIVLLGGKTTIDIQRKNVNKAKAVLRLISKYGYKPENLIYFGDEFMLHGNDLPVAEMDATVRPKIILHVGDKDKTPAHLIRLNGFLVDGNGPIGTQNYLKFLDNEH